MQAKKDIERRIDKEEQKISELRSQIEHEEAFLQGLQEALRMISKDGDNKPRKGKGRVRKGSDMAKIISLIKQKGKPMYISEILIGLGKEDTKANRMSIAGSLGRYVRGGNVFSRVGPNLFSLKSMQVSSKIELPPDFGAEEISPQSKHLRS
jgi:hypothetical protein